VLALLLAAALAQSPAEPRLAVVVTQRTGLSPERADAIAQKVSDALSTRGVDIASGAKASAKALSAAAIFSGGVDCQGKRTCVSGLGRVLRVWGVLAVELADLDGTLAVHLELVDSDKGDRHAEIDVVLPTKRAEAEITPKVVPIISEVKAALEKARPADAAEEAPSATSPPVAPPPEPEAFVPAVEAPHRRATPSRAPAVLAFGVGVAAAAISVVFVVLAGQARSELDAHTMMMSAFDVTRAQAQSLATRANTDYSIALGCGIAAAVMVLTGGLLLALR
jgi:hypothetical protein